MNKFIHRQLVRQILSTLILVPCLTACGQKFSFQAVQTACEPPETSARFGKNEGPVITGPAIGALTNGMMSLEGTCVTGQDVFIGGRGVTNPAAIPCNSGLFSAPVSLGNGDGTKEVEVYQKTNAAFDVLDRRCFQKDATPPKVTISGTSGTQSISTTNFTIEGSCETGLSVLLSGPDMPTSVTTTCTNGRFSAPVALTSTDGTKNVIAKQVDPVGNVGTDDQNYVTDRIAPVVTIVSPAEGATVPAAITITGTCESNEGRVIITGAGLSRMLSTDCIGNTFRTSAVLQAPDGAKTFNAAQTDLAGNVGFAVRNVVLKTAEQGYITFRSKGAGGLVDILFIDDNSGSMAPEQLLLGNKFSTFATALTSVNWQIGITTTDCSTGPYGICGSLLEMAGTGLSILTKAIPNYETVFENTIRRPETYDPVTNKDCASTNSCPSGDEVPLAASISAMKKKDGDNKGFFRDGADLSIVYLSDEDEKSNGGPGATEATEVVSEFGKIWPVDKKFIAYGIVIKPDDQACLDMQRGQSATGGSYGTKVRDLVNLTGGSLYSICDNDYSLTLKDIGLNVTRYSKTVTLAQTPIAGSVRVVFTPTWNSTISVSGRNVTINTPAPLGTIVEVYYKY